MHRDLTSLVDEKVGELSTRPMVDAWAACAAVWAHAFVLAGPGSTRWPEVWRAVGDGLLAAVAVATSEGEQAPAGDLVARLEAFDVEDDGSAEWQYLIDVTSMLLSALTGDGALACATTTLTTYLEGTFNIIANDLATVGGRPISQAEASHKVPEDDRWRRAVAFVSAL